MACTHMRIDTAWRDAVISHISRYRNIIYLNIYLFAYVPIFDMNGIYGDIVQPHMPSEEAQNAK